MPQIAITLTDAQFAAIAANVPGKDDDTARVTTYVQAQVDAVAAQHLARAEAAAFVAAGLPPSLATIGLDDDQKALLLSDGQAKVAAKEAARLAAAPAIVVK